MAYTKTVWIDKAVQYARRFFMNWDGGNDKNLLPPFSDWTKHANVTINSEYTATLVSTGTNQGILIQVPALPSTQYKLQSTLTASTGVFNAQVHSLDVNNVATYLTEINTGTSSSVTVTTRSDTVRLQVNCFNSSGIGTFTINNPQLELGSTATTFAPKKMYTITQSGGTVTAAGTPMNAANFNKMEQGIADAHTTADAVASKIGGTTGAINNATGYQWGGVTMAQTRVTNGYVEWNDGGTWKPMGDLPVGLARNFSNQPSGTANTFTTVVNVTGVYGRLDYIKVDVPPGSIGEIRVTLDGLADTLTGTLNTGGVNLALQYLQGTEEPIRFNNSLKIEIKSTVGGAGAVLGFYGYRLKSGTP